MNAYSLYWKERTGVFIIDEAIKGRNAVSLSAVKFSLTQGEEVICLKPPRHQVAMEGETQFHAKCIGSVLFWCALIIHEQAVVM